jgi:monomeric isocitrate dehydrogenase
MEAAGAVEFLASIVSSTTVEEASSGDALSILYSLQLSEAALKILIGKNGELIKSYIRIMQRCSYESCAYSILLLKSMMEVADPMQMIKLETEFFVEILQVLHDQISQQATSAALKLLIQLCPWGRNRIKAG